MPYLHISAQSGDDLILKRMKRRHNRQELLDFCKRARELSGLHYPSDRKISEYLFKELIKYKLVK